MPGRIAERIDIRGIEIKGLFEQRDAATDRRFIAPLQMVTAAQ